MEMQAVNEAEVEIVRTNSGRTQFLIGGQNPKEPSAMIRHFGPETDLGVHSHPYNEMWYVLEGEMIIGDTVYTPGSCVIIPKDTRYEPTRAPKGCRVLRYAEAAEG